ncbi:hypothetical protein M9H77_18787 [Catharanthus roseus]|uniref:Uncharacterized protein n=1 Tax=Catharanthus roseus TaxID=4058 RepID=A0ACC0B8F7_CATRO|nr:hypothetical protein M9H77_18787 [Catharanthus roseus]
MDAEAGEFQDWEVLHSNSDSESGLVNSGAYGENDSEDIDAHSGGMIHADYFSIDAQQNRYRGTVAGANMSEEGSENSDNPSWIDPGSENRYPRKEAAEFWSDSGSDRSDDRKFNELEGGNEMGLSGKGKLLVGLGDIEEISGGNEKESEKFEKFWSDSGGIEVGSVKVGDFEENGGLSLANAISEVPHEEKSEKESVEGEKEDVNVENEPRKAEEVEKKPTVVWWKVPMEFLKYCVFRVSPVWTFSVAAAVMGFVILGRRLYKMKKKTPRGLELKVTMDDKVNLSPLALYCFIMLFSCIYIELRSYILSLLRLTVTAELL